MAETDKPTLKRRIPVPFFLSPTVLLATTNRGLSSDRITFPYRVVKVEAHFTDDANNLLQVWAFVSRNSNVGTAPPPDNKILGFYSPTPYLIGNGEVVKVDCDVIPDVQEQFLKVYFVNANAYAVAGYCIITIETLEGVSAEGEIVSVGVDERKFTQEDYQNILRKRSGAVVAESMSAFSGSEKWVNQVIENRAVLKGETIDAFRLQAEALATVQNYFKPQTPLSALESELHFWFPKAWQLADKYTTGREVGAASTLLGGVNISEYKIKEEEEIWGITKEMGKINEVIYDIAINQRVEQKTNEYYPFKIPAVADLINMVVKEKITLETFQNEMLKNGFSFAWSQSIWDAHFFAPDFETVKRAIWREGITHDEIPDFLKRVDLDPFYNDKVWYPLLYEVPAYMDLINMRVKEVITQDTFSKAIQTHGYYDPWSQRLWDAHFTPASFSDFLTAMRRKLSVTIPVAEGTPQPYTFGAELAKDEQTIKDLSVLADYDPRYWDFFKTRMFNDPSYRMIMWGFETNSIKREEIPDLVHRLGLNPKDESWYANFLVHFQERPWINRYLTALQTAYIQGAVTADDLIQRVMTVPRNEDIAKWMIKIAEVRKEVLAKGTKTEEQKLVSIPELKKAYVFGLMNEDNFRTELMSRGFTLLDVDLLINIMRKETEIADVGGKKEGLTVAEYFDAFRYGEISEDTLRTELMIKGLNLDQVNILIETKKKKWAMGGVESEQA